MNESFHTTRVNRLTIHRQFIFNNNTINISRCVKNVHDARVAYGVNPALRIYNALLLICLCSNMLINIWMFNNNTLMA